MSIKSSLKDNMFMMYMYDKLKEFYYKYLLSDKRILQKRFRERLDRELDLENPVKFNDKLQWLKLYWRDPLATQCADKYGVREYIKEKIGAQYLNELIAVYDSVDEINIDKLPNSFVLKGTHGSGFNIICKDKYKMDWDKELRKMRRWMWTNYHWPKREWVYKDIKPRIICEKYLEDENGELRDYKIFCFNGSPKFIIVDFDRFSNHRRNVYDLEWNFLDIEINKPNDEDTVIKKPPLLKEMIDLSRKLSKPFPHVRVDFYIHNSKIIFGELTFFHASGMGYFKPQELEIKLGNYLELPYEK